MNPKQTLIGGVLAGIGASVCCVGPLILLSLGLGGSWVASLSAFAPARPVFLGLTLLFLGLAFRKLYLSPEVCEAGKPCLDKGSLQRQRLIFWVVTVPLLGLVSFPWFAPLFY